jgi:hypothetical protein
MELQNQLRKWTLLIGVIQITFGCIVGFIPPTAVDWFRGIVSAHIQFTSNGVLMVVFGFLLTEMRLSDKLLKVWFAMVQVGTWTNGLALLMAAFLGASSTLMPTINEKFPPPNGIEHFLVSTTLKICGVTIMIALLLTIYGMVAKSKKGT